MLKLENNIRVRKIQVQIKILIILIEELHILMILIEILEIKELIIIKVTNGKITKDKIEVIMKTHMMLMIDLDSNINKWINKGWT
jgi:hypothetical protein